MAGCKSIGADGCKSSGRRKSNLRRRRDARGSEAESAGGWSSAAAVQRIPHPALLPAPGSLGHTQYVRGFSSWDCCYGKTLQQAFRHPGRRFPLGFIAWGGSRHRRVWVKGIADSSSGSSRWSGVPNITSPAGLFCSRGSGMGGLGVNPSMMREEGPHPSPQQCCDLSTASGPGQCCPVHPSLQQEKHFRLQELTHRVYGHHVCPPPQGPPASSTSWQLEKLSAPANAMSGRETKEITVIDFSSLA